MESCDTSRQSRVSSTLSKAAKAAALLLALAAAIGGCGRKPDNGAAVLKVASALPQEHPSSKALAFFQNTLNEISGGQIEVRLFLNGQLGSTIETLESCQCGNIEAVYTSAASLAQFAPRLNVFCMPFIFRDTEHAYAVLDGPVGNEIAAPLKDIGLRHLGYFDAGSRNIMTKRGPVQTPEDLRGMKIRVMESHLMISTVNAVGALAVAMAQGDVYGALQTGVLDGWENNPQTAMSFRMHETGCRFFAWTRHFSIPDMLIVSNAFYERLTPAQQQWVDQAARDTVVYQWQLWQENNAVVIKELEAEGMVFNTVDRDAFEARVRPIYEQSYAKYGPEFEAICRRIQEVKP